MWQISPLLQKPLDLGQVHAKPEEYLPVNDEHRRDKSPDDLLQFLHVRGVGGHVLFRVRDVVLGEETLRRLTVPSSGLGVDDDTLFLA